MLCPRDSLQSLEIWICRHPEKNKAKQKSRPALYAPLHGPWERTDALGSALEILRTSCRPSLTPSEFRIADHGCLGSLGGVPARVTIRAQRKRPDGTYALSYLRIFVCLRMHVCTHVCMYACVHVYARACACKPMYFACMQDLLVLICLLL